MNVLLYLITCTIWGSTWYAIKLQTGVVPPVWSVVYRFGIAAIVLFFVCLILKRSLRFSFRQHQALALQGFILFSLNYLLFYSSEQYLVSGIAALIAATISLMNIANGRIFLGNRSSLRTIIGALLGLAGLILALWAEVIGFIHNANRAEHVLLGCALALAGTYAASMGNIIAAHNQKRSLPILESNCISMAYGALFMIFFAFGSNQPIAFNFTVSYSVSLLYLAIFGSVIAFQTYLSLIGRIGPARAAYVFVITPVIALVISTYLEGFQWSIYKLLGIGLVICGNILILNFPGRQKVS